MDKSGSVIQEIQKRPFLRPLFFWIAGILFQVCFPLQAVSLVLPLFIVVILVISFFLYKQDEALFVFGNRWVWGVVFMGMVVFLAIQMTYLAELRLQSQAAPVFLLRKAQEVQLVMVERLSALRLPDSNKSVLATLTVNYRQAMTRELMNQFSITGVSHLLAVSGFHVGIVGAFVSALLSFLPDRKTVFRWGRYIVTMLCIWMFAYISGLTAASTRAAVMLTIYLTGHVLRRRPDKYNTLAGAAFFMLVYNPFYLFDVGFQLSYVAVFFILYLQPRFSRLIEIRNPLIANPWNVLTVTVAAQIGTVFLCFYYFGKSSVVFLFTNLFLSLLATLLIPATLLWMIIPTWMPGMDWLRMAIETMSRCMMWVVDHFSAIPGVTLSVRFDFFTLVFSYLCLAFVLLYFRLRRYWMLIAALGTLLVILCWHLI